MRTTLMFLSKLTASLMGEKPAERTFHKRFALSHDLRHHKTARHSLNSIRHSAQHSKPESRMYINEENNRQLTAKIIIL